MRPRQIQPTPTPNRLHYLRQCERLGTYMPRHGVTANHCLRLGWVETVVRVRGGDLVAFSDLTPEERRTGDYGFMGQRITAAGRAVLDKVYSRSIP